MNSKANILLIEDNPADSNLIQIYLKSSSLKYKLHIAETFFDGCAFLKEHEISLVLLDLSLPDSSGFKTLTNYLSKFPKVPVIVLTGMKNEIIENQAVKAGCQDFLVKGQFDGKLIGRSIRYAIQRFKTQLKLEEVAKNLALSEKRYVEAQEMARFGNWEMDIVSNTMHWSDEIFRIFGYEPNKFTPTLSDYINFVHIEDRNAVETFFEEAAKDGQLHKLEHRALIEGVTIKHIAIQAKVYFEEINNKIILVGAIQDITERKLSEQLIIEKNMTQKVSKVKEEVLADMGFHIRTPLSSIVNLLFLMDNPSASSQQKEYIEGLKISVDDLSIMVNNLLNFSLLASEKIKLEEELFDIQHFIQGIKKVVQLKAETANIDLQFNLAEDLPEKVISDYNKISQILYNLIDNCIKKSKEDNTISIALSSKKNESNGELLDLCFMLTDHKNVLTSKDVSNLIEADRLLENYTIEEENQQQQMGAAIVAKLVKTLGGTMDIKSSKDKGSIFDIKIPVTPAKPTLHQATGAPDAPLKILLVEDHFLNQIATKKVLTTWSDMVTVDIAENGLIGVEKFRAHGYDIILMDIQMPVMTGLEAAKKIREKSNVPIIALTANTSKQEADKCLDIGINDYLGKPFKPQDLYSKIMSLLVTVSN